MPNHSWEPHQPVYASLSTGTPSSLNIPPSPPSFPLRPDQYVHVRPPDPSAPLGTFEHPFPYGYVHSDQGTSTAPAAADETGTQHSTDSASSSTTSLVSPPSPRQPAPRRRVRFNVPEDHRPSNRSIPSSPHPSRLGFGSPSSTDHASRGRVAPPPTTLTTHPPPSQPHLRPSSQPHPPSPSHNPRCIICDTTPAIPSASEPDLAFCEECWDRCEKAEVEWLTDV